MGESRMQHEMTDGLLPQEAAQALVEKVLSLCAADQAEATCRGFSRGATRYANNAITQNLAKTDASVSVKVAFGQRAGSAATNDFSDRGLEELVRRAESIARHSEPDPELMPPLPPQTYLSPQAYCPETVSLSPMDRAEAIRSAAAVCDRQGLKAAGSFTTEARFDALGNSTGLRAYHRATSARFLCTALAGDSSGWAESASHDIGRISPAGAAERAAAKALAARNPVTLEPRPYTVILEPAAVAELLQFLAYTLDAKAADEGTTAFSGLEGTRIGSDLVTLESDPADPRCPAWPYHSDGGTASPVTWIDHGTLKTLSYSRYWAGQKGYPYNGRPGNLLLRGTDTPLEDLVAGVEDGLLVTRFWYIRFVEPKTLLLTGMTRDGLFRIEKGRVTRGLTHFRFNESPLKVLVNVEAVGTPALCLEGTPTLAPPVVVTDFNFSSGTTF